MRGTRITALCLVLLAALMLVAAGCGSSSKNSAATTEETTTEATTTTEDWLGRFLLDCLGGFDWISVLRSHETIFLWSRSG